MKNNQNYETAKRNSRDSRNVVSAGRKKVSKSKIRAAKLRGIAIGAVAAIGVMQGADYAIEKFEDMAAQKEYKANLYDVIGDHSYVDYNGEHVDSVSIGVEFKEMVESGQYQEDTVVYVAANALSRDYESDERNTVVRLVSGMNSSEWLSSHGYSSFQDEEFKKNVEESILRQVKLQETQNSLASMLNEQQDLNKVGANTSMKGMGGK